MKSPLSNHIAPFAAVSFQKSFLSLFAGALAAGLSVSSVFAQQYYPDANSPIGGNPDLQAIEFQLNAVNPNATLAVPPPAGKTVATDLELSQATARAVGDEIDGTDVAGVTVASLVSEASKYRPAKTGRIISEVTAAIIATGTAAQITANLEAATGAAAAANPKGAKSVVASALKVIATPASTTAGNADDIVEETIENAKAFADKITSAAIKGLKKAPVADIPTLVQDVTTEAVQTIFQVNAVNLLEEVVSAASAAGTSLNVPLGSILNRAFLQLAGPNNTQENAGAIVAGALRGVGTSGVAVVKQQAQTDTTFDAYTDVVADAFNATRSALPEASADAFEAFVSAANRDLIAAAVTGGVAGVQRFAPEIVERALREDNTLAGNDTTAEIITAGVRANPKAAAKIVTAAVGEAGAALVEITQGAVGAAPIELSGAIVTAALKAAGGKDAALSDVQAVVTGGINAVEVVQPGAIAGIAQAAARTSKQSEAVLNAALLAVPTNLQYQAVIGTIAGDKKNAFAIRTAALDGTAPSVAPSQVAPTTLGADTAIAVQGNSKNFFNIAQQAFGQADTEAKTLAVIYGAGLVNPKGAAAIASLAIKRTAFDPATITAAATNTNRKAAVGIDLATRTAQFVKSPGGVVGLFDFVDHLVFENPKFAGEIVTGAAVVAPDKAHFAGHAAAFRAPTRANKVIAALFAFTNLDNQNPVGAITNPPAAAAALMAGVTVGVLEAKLDPTDPTRRKEGAALKSAVSTAVKAALLLEGTAVRTSDGTPGGMVSFSPTKNGPAGVVTGYISQVVDVGQTDINGGATGIIGAAITAAVKAAKAHALSIAQAAAQAASFIAFPTNPALRATYDGTAIAMAVANAGVISFAQAKAAVDFGKSEAVAGTVGAGAAGVVNYAHHTGTGSPVTSIFDL